MYKSQVFALIKFGVLGGVRTHGLGIRNPTLYPAELQGQIPFAFLITQKDDFDKHFILYYNDI